MNNEQIASDIKNIDFAGLAKTLYRYLGDKEYMYAYYCAKSRQTKYSFDANGASHLHEVGFLSQQQINDIPLEDLIYSYEDINDKSKIPATVKRFRIETYLVDLFLNQKQDIIERALINA